MPGMPLHIPAHPAAAAPFFIHSSLQVITKEKDKMAPLGFTSPVEFYKRLQARREGGERERSSAMELVPGRH